MDQQIRTDGGRRGGQRLVDPAVDLLHFLERAGADIGVQLCHTRDRIGRRAGLRQDGVPADIVLFLKRLTQRVAGGDAERRGIEGVDALMRREAGVRRFADILKMLGDAAVRALVDGEERGLL